MGSSFSMSGDGTFPLQRRRPALPDLPSQFCESIYREKRINMVSGYVTFYGKSHLRHPYNKGTDKNLLLTFKDKKNVKIEIFGCFKKVGTLRLSLHTRLIV